MYVHYIQKKATYQNHIFVLHYRIFPILTMCEFQQKRNPAPGDYEFNLKKNIDDEVMLLVCLKIHIRFYNNDNSIEFLKFHKRDNYLFYLNQFKYFSIPVLLVFSRFFESPSW